MARFERKTGSCLIFRREGKGREGKGKGREGKGREREGKGREREGKGRDNLKTF